MPEVIEVKSYTEFIKKNIKNHLLENITIKNGRYKTHNPFEHYGKIISELPIKVKDVMNKGKLMVILFENNISMAFTLGLSGGWFFEKSGKNMMIHGLSDQRYNTEITDKYIDNAKNHINVDFQFNNGNLLFYDTLSYGTIHIYLNKEDLEKRLNSIGPDIMNISLGDFEKQIFLKKNKEKKIGTVLTDQKVISGIGNYLRADLLWLCKISPYRLVKNITKNEIKELYHQVQVLTWGYVDFDKAKKEGIIHKSNILPFQYPNRSFFCYIQDNDIYGNKVIKEKFDNDRMIYWVKERQK